MSSVGRKWWIGLVAVIVVAIGAVVFWPRPKEPEYQGKKLSEWLEICRYDRLPKYGNPAVPEEQLRVAVKAIRQIGTNALPWLMRWAFYKPSIWKTKSLAALDRIPFGARIKHEIYPGRAE